MLKLGELGETSFGIVHLSELGLLSFGMLKSSGLGDIII